VIKPRWHEPQTADERAAETAWVRQIQSGGGTSLLTSVVRVGAGCPDCGRPVAEVNVEPLEYERQDGMLTAASYVAVALPCGHAFVSEG
jgi:hypothetical protein